MQHDVFEVGTHVVPHALVHVDLGVHEETLGGSGPACAICDLLLVHQLVCIVDGHDHGLHSEESSQVGRVAADDDQREEPPHATHDTRRRSPATIISTLFSWRFY